MGSTLTNTCHPDQPYYAKALCRTCYSRERQRRVRGYPRARPKRPWSPAEMAQSIMAKLDRTGECWLWTGKTQAGYGSVQVTEGIRTAHFRVHRLIYEAFVGPIPEGKYLDHLCRVKACANPKHLEPVTHGENVRRGWLYRTRISVCKRGHRMIPANVRTRVRETWTERSCRQCERERVWKVYWRKKGRAAWLAA